MASFNLSLLIVISMYAKIKQKKNGRENIPKNQLMLQAQMSSKTKEIRALGTNGFKHTQYDINTILSFQVVCRLYLYLE